MEPAPKRNDLDGPPGSLAKAAGDAPPPAACNAPPASPPSEAALIALLTECQLPLGLYVRSLMPGDAAAHDVLQQANAKIWEKRAEFQLGTNFKAWALAVARFEVLNYRKQQARDARLVFSQELEKTIAEELEHADDDLMQRHQALQQCLQSLKAESRQLLMHRYASAEPLSQYAGRVGRSVSSLKVTLFRLRASLAECVERRLRVEGGPQ